MAGTTVDAASGNPFPGGNKDASDLLGLGDMLQKDMLDEEEKRKLALKNGVQANPTGTGILSPATMALFAGKY